MCDNLTLPFKDCSLDAVLSIAVIHHFSTTERRVCALRELARVLRIGGRIIITVWAMERRQRKVKYSSYTVLDYYVYKYNNKYGGIFFSIV